MTPTHYDVLPFNDKWMVVHEGLRSGPYPNEDVAERIAQRMADLAPGSDVRVCPPNGNAEAARPPKWSV